jgi:hypothetical protein
MVHLVAARLNTDLEATRRSIPHPISLQRLLKLALPIWHKFGRGVEKQWQSTFSALEL